MGRTLVWMTDDLRTVDNLALATAMAEPGCAAVLRVRPEARGRPARTVGRRRLEEAAEATIAERLGAVGVPFEAAGAGDDSSISAWCRRLGCNAVVRNAADGTPLENIYRAEAEDDLRTSGIPSRTVNGTAIALTGPGSEAALQPHLGPGGMPRTAVSEEEPIARLRVFLAALPSRGYRQGMWMPGRDRDATSLLSTDIAAGTLSGDRAEAETARAEQAWHAANPGCAGTPEGRSFRSFAARLGWRRGFMEAFSGSTEPRPPPPLPASDRAAMAAWATGTTGVPMVDAAMRELAATGWANFRMRQTVASFAIQTLGLPAYDAGMRLAELFDDYEPGITWLQMGLHAGTVGRSRGPRIVNPVKQGRELDPDETYVRRWLPELAALPSGFAHEPWRHPDSPLPPPIVDHEAAARTARARWPGEQTGAGGTGQPLLL